MLKMPMTVAGRKGIGHLTNAASDKTVVLTNHGRPVAVVMSPQEYDEQRRISRETADSVLATGSALVGECSDHMDSEEARDRPAGR